MEPTSLAMNLAQLVREGLWDELETAWTEHVLATASLPPALEAVAAAAQKKEVQRCLPFVREHAEALVAASRPADAVELLGATMLLGGSPGELGKMLLEHAGAAFGEEPYYELYRELSGLREGAPDLRAAWRKFRKALALSEGRVVYHAAGWGLGRIDTLDLVTRETTVRFTSGKSDRFPLQSALDIFEVLELGDLRCLVVNDPKGLEKMLKEEPLEVLRWVVVRNDGRVNQAGIKLAMGTLGIDGSRFTQWWKRAQKAAEGSEWFEISGPPNKSVVRLLARAEDPVASIRRQVLRSRDLGEALTRVRTLFQGTSVSEEVRTTALDALDELANAGGPLPQRLAVWLFVREQRGTSPAPLLALVDKARAIPTPADRSQPSALWTLFGTVPGVREQERCIDLLKESFGDDSWLAEVETNLHHAPSGMVRGLVDALEAAGRTENLGQHYASLLARPTKNPALLVRLAERIEATEQAARIAPAQQRLQSLLHLAVSLNDVTSANPALARARAKLAQVLTEGKPSLMRRLLEKATNEELRVFAQLIESGVERAIDRCFTQVAVELSPEIFRHDEKEFWESDHIWTTRAGLLQRQEELRVLRDIKIPDNAEAIGRAASYGDLSENAEWTAALEEQRNLTGRAMELEAELERARMIENAILPEQTVCPGSKVRYRELPAGKLQEIEILGPWDADGEKRISYRSPLAAGMLGKHPGDEVDITLPSAQIRVRIEGVQTSSFT
ncbi:MAG: GreA/GreB family elongation factor [Planctomycetota bacterium]